MPLRDSSPTKAVHDFLPDGVANARSSTTLHFHATVPRWGRQSKRGRLLAGSYPRGGYATSGEEMAKGNQFPPGQIPSGSASWTAPAAQHPASLTGANECR